MSILSFASRHEVRRNLFLVVTATVLGGALIASQVSARPEALAPTRSAAHDLTVVELFTSQGCSSCPPANANLTRLATRPDVLALSFGVTYWDQLGWTDTFGSPAYTARQRAYQQGLHNSNVWTPQVVIDGRDDVVGQNLHEIEGVIARHRAFTGPTVIFRNGGVGLAGGSNPGPADVWLVRYDPRIVDVPVRRGENGGRTLPHVDVVRQLTRLGSWEGRTVGFALPAPPMSGLSTAVLVQGPNGGPILAAAKG